MMVGREVVFRLEKPPVEAGETVLDVRGLCAADDRGLPALRDVSFSIRRGEILGVAGVDGNGQSELAEALTGLRQPTAGQVWLSGREVSRLGPRELHRRKVAHVPEDRHKVGLVLTFSVAENLLVKDFDRPPYARQGFLNNAAFSGHARDLIQEYSVRCPSPATPARLLSGGNQQKLVLAREIFNQPDLLVAVQPTRGLDVGATEYVEGRLLEERSRGAAILYISTELDEIMALSDRIAVLYNGQIMGILEAAEATVETVGLLMAGTRASPFAA
jgi:general nucleoside transport system ATP-binding protein